jgi:hypothetical protein
MFGGGGMVFFVTGASESDTTCLGNPQQQDGSATPPPSDGPGLGIIAPLFYQLGNDDGLGFESAVWHGDEGGVQFVQIAHHQDDSPVAAAQETPSNWTRLWGVFDVIGGLGETAVGTTGVVASGVGTVFSGGSAAPVSIPLLFGSSVLTLHGIDQAWAGIATVYWGTRQRPIAAQALDRVTGNETASDVLNGVAGATATGGVGLAVKGAGLGTRALSIGDDVGRAATTTLDDGAKVAGSAPHPVPPLASVIDGHCAQQGFTGVIDGATGKVLIRPSTAASDVPSGWVARSGGHAEVSRAIGGNTGSHRGFAVILHEDGSLAVTWRSGVLNSPPDYVVPLEMRQAIVNAIEAATGRKVSSF